LIEISECSEGRLAVKELIMKIAQAIVDNPEKVSVSIVEGRQSSIVELKLAKEDIGKIIGKQGRNANALRIILNAVAAKEKKRIVLEIME
jgi:predicted RNA-binding protein YlqC (UPF0109 family)